MHAPVVAEIIGSLLLGLTDRGTAFVRLFSVVGVQICERQREIGGINGRGNGRKVVFSSTIQSK
jgi:hypothetical protein